MLLGARQKDVNMSRFVRNSWCAWSLPNYFNLAPIYHLYILFVEISYLARMQDFVFKYILQQFYF